jgi:hypothetical protein
MLEARSKHLHGTGRAINRVIEEDYLCLAPVRASEAEEVAMTIEREDWTAEALVTVRLYPGDRDADIEDVVYPEGVYMGDLTIEEEGRAREAAWRQRAES